MTIHSIQLRVLTIAIIVFMIGLIFWQHPVRAAGLHHHHAHHVSRHHRRHHASRGLPWCGIYMTQKTGIKKRSLWIARNWAKEGSPASPGEGVIVVWPHHVGMIVGRGPRGGWLVNSGNDGGMIRTRERSIAGAIAFRRV